MIANHDQAQHDWCIGGATALEGPKDGQGPPASPGPPSSTGKEGPP